MNPVFWTSNQQTEVKQYLERKLGGTWNVVLPSTTAIASLNYPDISDSMDPISGMNVTRVTETVQKLGANTATVTAPFIKVGKRIYIYTYEGQPAGTNPFERQNSFGKIGDSDVQCPFPNFHQCVLRDLRVIAGQYTGRRLLNSIEDNTNDTSRIYIRFCEGFSNRSNNTPFPVDVVPGLKENGTPSASSSTRVQYNPLIFGLPKVPGSYERDDSFKVGQWGSPEQKPPDVTLFHELIHADDTLRGILDQSPLGNTNMAVCEQRTVGLDDFDDDSLYTENTYRRERGFVTREYYTSKQEIPARRQGTGPKSRRLLQYLEPKSLMTLAAFRAATTHAGKRNKILAVERALSKYNRECAWTDDNMKKVVGLVEVLKSCENYKALPDAKRNVGSLVAAASTALSTIVPNILPPDPGTLTKDPFVELRKLGGSIQESFDNNTDVGSGTRLSQTEQSINGMAGVLVRKTQGLSFGNVTGHEAGEPLVSPNMLTELQGYDVALLDAIVQDGSTPDITKDIIREAIAHAYNADDVTPLDARGGGSNAGPKNNTWIFKYSQHYADDIRLGTMVHEMTHILNGKAFRNTSCMFSYPADTDARQIKQIMKTRETRVRALIDLVKKDRTFRKHHRRWLIDQQDGKLNYAIALNPALVLQNVMGTDKQALYNGILGETQDKISQSLWDYETVLHQILIYLKIWGIDIDNPFYARVRQYAQESYQERARARLH